MSFTYDITTPRGQVRFLIGDTTSPGIFADVEVDFCLTQAGNDINIAGAIAFETWARSQSKLAKSISENGFSTERRSASELLALAQNLRNSANDNGLQTGSLQAGSEHLDSYRPDWRYIGNPPVVE